MQTRCEAPSWGGPRAGHGPWCCLKQQEWPTDRARPDPWRRGEVPQITRWTEAVVVIRSKRDKLPR
eukprot:8362255-Prorocentrum_lima.AAC.1